MSANVIGLFINIFCGLLPCLCSWYCYVIVLPHFLIIVQHFIIVLPHVIQLFFLVLVISYFMDLFFMEHWCGHVLMKEDGHILRRAVWFEVERQRKRGGGEDMKEAA